jgi:hypothetical protein
MKKSALIMVIIVSVAIWSCGNSDSANKSGDQTTTENQKVENTESKLPDGYPAELTLPPGFKPSNINTGTGSSSGMGGDRTYKSYKIWKMMPDNAPAIIDHYKKLLADLQYEGGWKGDGENESARGVFKKGQNELSLSISSETFEFNLKIWDK